MITGETKADIIWRCPVCNCCTKARSQSEARENLNTFTNANYKNHRCTHWAVRPQKPHLR